MTVKRKPLPQLPRSVYFPAGRVSVKRRKGLMESEKAFGMFNWVKREILIDADLELNAAWLTLEHEKVHVVFIDAGIQLEEYVEERLCDALAASRVAEMLR
jgi:hypothetical protein